MDFYERFLSFSFSFDRLSAFFVFVILLISIPSAFYSVGYLKGAYSNKKIILNWMFFIGFVLSMLFVVTISNAFLFLIFWEVMSLISYFLVIFDSEHEKSKSAGLIYIVMTHIGTALIIVGILIIFKYSNFATFEYSVLKNACQTMPLKVKNIVFLCFLFGFGTKAGIVPLHIWLPLAHPQAPSHISSIMSGVMIKTAIYGMLRFIIYILGVEQTWWGGLVLVIAAVSCLIGVIYALMEHDIKKLLAYHSVENIGIILLGVGASMVFIKMDLPLLSVLALSAGLYHLINHAIFKSLLFLCAGSVYKSAKTRNIEKLGGLIKNMPWTSSAFLIGSMAISAIPPFNGFVSEWLTLQAFFLGAINSSGVIKVFMCIMAAVLALTGGLAAACFVKAFGVTFLAMPRSKKASEAKEVSLSMKIPVIFMSFLTLAFGIGAGFIIKRLVQISKSVLETDIYNTNFSLNNFAVMTQADGSTFLSAPLFLFVLITVVCVVIIIIYFKYGKNRITANKTWDCGYYALDSRMEYTATGFSKPFRIAFGFFLKPYKNVEKIRESYYQVKSYKYELYTTQVFGKYLYDPLIKMTYKIAKKVRRLQPGSIHLYLGYIFITIITLIIFLKRF